MSMRARHAKRGGDRGAVAIVVALFVIVSIVLLAFVVDRGRVYVSKAQLQNAVDAAALAGAQEFCISGGNAAAVATAYANANGAPGALVTVSSVGTSRYLNVRASTNVPAVFSGFIGVQSANVAAQATTTRPCLSRYQFVADQDFDFSGQGANIVGGIYAGRCFQGSNGTFDLVAVSTDDSPPYDCSPFHNGALPIDNGSRNPVCNNSASVEQCLFNQSTSTLIAFQNIFGTDPGTYRAAIPSTGACGSPNYGADINCTGNVAVPASQLISHDVIATGNIVTDNSTTFTPPVYDVNGQVTNWILLYSLTGEIDLKMNALPANVVVYAPTNPGGGQDSINYLGSGAGLDGILLGYDLNFNGGNVDGGNSVALSGVGEVSLIQ